MEFYRRGGKGWEIRRKWEDFAPPLGCGIDLKRSHPASHSRKRKKNTADTEAHTYTHTHSTTTTNSWRRRQTRRELISSPTRRGLQGEKERGREGETEEDVEELFLPMCGSQACGPLIPLTLTPLLCHSQRHVSLYLPISPSINLHLPCSSLWGHPPSSPPLPSSTPSLRCFRCVTSSQTAGEQAETRN